MTEILPTHTINHTLVPVDFSDTSLLALDHAVAISDMGPDKEIITLLHVIEGADIDEMVTAADPLKLDHRDALAAEGALVKLRKLADNFDREKTEFRAVVIGGKPYRKIAKVARETKPDYIMMGTHGSSGLQVLAGSNASRVIQLAPCPVIVVKEKQFGNGYQNIVLPLDVTRETKQKVNMASRVAKYFDATVHILALQERDEFLAHRMKANLNQVQEYMEDRGIKTSVHTLTSSSNLATQTLEWADENNADLIIIMSQQEKGTLGEFLYGSYAQQMVNRSHVPVMAINPREDLEGVVPGII